MEEVIISEQEIVNAICLFISDKKQISTDHVKTELIFDDDYGFSAEVYVDERKQVLIESNIIEAIRFWIEREMQKDPYSASLQLQLDPQEGIVALYQS
ncbi:DUF2653 family protein [Sporolactobacillus shoreae]|uniref:DUF2653 family protein n=1 Tax=Sporolactobacillus shoreae TaxID=1465501 RepID=A0A4Z0GJJ0_9BACL|nr:DUF2653 family protein [Sporolactobacillus shoreae]TGA96174.1 DUF2653 family protein [Sporolactobacillus shoreae]